MKVSKQNLELMSNCITVMLQNIVKAPFTKADIEQLDISTKYSLWAKVVHNHKFDNNNGNVLTVNGKRMFEHNPNFEFYLDGTNDKTIETALDYVFTKMIGDIAPAGNVVKRITDN